MIRRTLILIFAILAFSAFGAAAQESIESQVRSKTATLDSTLVGKSIFSILPSADRGAKATVTVHQSQAIQNGLSGHIAANSSKKISGYRIRIFSDNKQNARSASEAAMGRFKGMYPGMSAYKTYSNPFFKVTVGDFRTRSEAIRVLNQLKGSFPTAFIVAETINYPAD